ncbi:hypothetical protein [Paenibacillus solani]
MTFNKFVKEWRYIYANKHLELKIIENYSHMLKNHIDPVFGGRRWDEIKPLYHSYYFKLTAIQHSVRQ